MQAFSGIGFVTHHPSSKIKHWQGQYEILSVVSQGTFGTLEYIFDIGGDCYHKSRQVTTALPKGI